VAREYLNKSSNKAAAPKWLRYPDPCGHVARGRPSRCPARTSRNDTPGSGTTYPLLDKTPDTFVVAPGVGHRSPTPRCGYAWSLPNAARLRLESRAALSPRFAGITILEPAGVHARPPGRGGSEVSR
jgi:hypothetical protein